MALPVIGVADLVSLRLASDTNGRLISLRLAVGEVHGWKMRPIWYVTYEVHKHGVLPKRRSPRLTTTFETEAEAKDFARARLQEGLIVFAGTINPHVPRQLVSSHDIAAWLADEGEAAAALRAATQTRLVWHQPKVLKWINIVGATLIQNAHPPNSRMKSSSAHQFS